MAPKSKQEAQNPLILRCNRIMEAFAKSNDERDFYLDRKEGFLTYADLDKSQEDLETLEKELLKNKDRYCMIPKLTFYEAKKIMEGFVNEKVYDIDTKEKLLDIIQSKEARENFLEFIYDHHAEFEKWQLYYQERSRIRIIEWLRTNHFHFVFEEDLELPKSMIEKLKRSLFDARAPKDIITARKTLFAKAKTYYSNEALNPRPKRGRPPKQAAKLEIEQQVSTDIFLTVPSEIRVFLFTPDISSASAITFSAKFEGDEDFLTHRRPGSVSADKESSLNEFNQKLAALRSLSSRWVDTESPKKEQTAQKLNNIKNEDLDDSEDNVDEFAAPPRKKLVNSGSKTSPKSPKATKSAKPKPVISKKPAPIKAKKIQKVSPPKKQPNTKWKAAKLTKTTPKKTPSKASPKKPPLRSIIKKKGKK